MTLPIYQVDAFTDQVFRGNPAAVMPLEAWLEDDRLQAIDRALADWLGEASLF